MKLILDMQIAHTNNDYINTTYYAMSSPWAVKQLTAQPCRLFIPICLVAPPWLTET